MFVVGDGEVIKSWRLQDAFKGAGDGRDRPLAAGRIQGDSLAGVGVAVGVGDAAADVDLVAPGSDGGPVRLT